MGFSGNPGEVKAYAKRLAHLAEKSKYIAKGAAPKIEALVKRTIAAGTDPYGAPHVPGKSGGPVLTGAASSSDITVRVERSGRAVKVVVGGILRFHHDGTKTGGRRTVAKIKRRIRARAGEFKATEVLSKKRWKAAGGTDATFALYKAEMKAANKFGKAAHKDSIAAAETAGIRAVKGRVWDPERPLIPNEAQGVPAAWKGAVLEDAHKLLETVGAEQKGGA